MQLSDGEERTLAQGAQFLEATQDLPTLLVGQFPESLLHELMASDKPDLVTMGCYLISRIDRSVDLSFLGASHASAHNYARVLLAELTVDQILGSTRHAHMGNIVRKLAAQQRPTPTPTGPSSPAASLTVIVHGTLANTYSWWQQGSNFWNHINNQVSDIYAGSNPYSWTGTNSHAARMNAAQDLVTWVQQNPSAYLRCIAHSHGGNVCFLATRLGLRIDKLITLGTPIRLEYLPDLRQIGILHNVFSTHDRIQTPTGTIPNRRGEGRTLGESDKTINHRATDDGSDGQPGHTDLHEPATWTASDLDALL